MTEELLNKYPLISDQVSKEQVRVILSELEKVLDSGTDGAIVEFGCYIGTTSLFIRRLLDRRGDSREFHVYDSFEGLPPKVSQDDSPAGTQFQAGELSVSKKDFLHEFQKANLRPPKVHKAWFSDRIHPQLAQSCTTEATARRDHHHRRLRPRSIAWCRKGSARALTSKAARQLHHCSQSGNHP
jgi:O-methyltransferase